MTLSRTVVGQVFTKRKEGGMSSIHEKHSFGKCVVIRIILSRFEKFVRFNFHYLYLLMFQRFFKT